MSLQSHKNPLVSVVLPVYNGERFIADAVKSVLMQEYEPVELIVVNDGSTDQTAKILKEFGDKLTCITQKNSGPSSARNRGIKASNGEYVAFIDADDIWMPGSVTFHMGQFTKYKNLEISVGLTSELDFKLPTEIDVAKAKEEAFLHLVMGASIMKKSVFKDVGLFDEELILRQDTDWFLRARELERKMAIGKELILIYRKHQNNRTNDLKKSNYYLFKMYKKASDRKARLKNSLDTVMRKPENLEELIEVWHNVKPK